MRKLIALVTLSAAIGVGAAATAAGTASAESPDSTPVVVTMAQDSPVSIADMFEMQMLMNHFSQISDSSTAVVSASNVAIASIARNIRS
jgi:hypothetical protein